MYLFSRRGRLAGGGTAGLEWANEVCTKVRAVSGHDLQLWATVYSASFGTVSWTAWFEDLASLEAVGDKLNADPGYQDLVGKGADLTEGAFDDSLLQPIFGAPDPSQDIQYAGGVTAVVAGGQFERALTAGVAITEKAQALTGLSTMFLRSLTGPYGSVGWLTGYPNITAMEAAADALGGDPAWMKLIDGTEGCFVEDPASNQQTLYRRLG